MTLEEEKKEPLELKETVKTTESSDVNKSSFASSSTDDKLKNEIDIFKILNNDEKRTTIMVRNIPNKFKQMFLLDMINLNHRNRYDYFYLPMDLKVKLRS